MTRHDGESPKNRGSAAAYSPREVVHELRSEARCKYGDATTDEDLDGTKELKIEYRAAIVLDRQTDRIELLEATLRSIAACPGKDEAEQLAAGALEYPADSVPNAVCAEDGDPAWVEVTPITETPEQVVGALKVNGMWTVEDDGTVYGYEAAYRVWMVPCVHRTERPLLTREALANVEYEDDIVYFEMNDQRGCETGSWWWRCNESLIEPEGADAPDRQEARARPARPLEGRLALSGRTDNAAYTERKGAGSIEIQVVGAIRLALEGAADDETLLRLVQWLVGVAPATDLDDTDSARLLIEGIRGIGGSVSTASPSGAYVSA